MKRFYFKIVFKGESIPVFWNNIQSEDYQSALINPIKDETPTVAHQYVEGVYDHLKIIDCLIQIPSDQIDQLVKTENHRRKYLL